MTGNVCCALAANGHMAGIIVIVLTKSRRRIAFPKRLGPRQPGCAITEAKQEILTYETGSCAIFAPQNDRSFDVRFGSWLCENAAGSRQSATKESNSQQR